MEEDKWSTLYNSTVHTSLDVCKSHNSLEEASNPATKISPESDGSVIESKNDSATDTENTDDGSAEPFYYLCMVNLMSKSFIFDIDNVYL